MLRAKKPSIKIGFFLHTPFPSSECYRLLPWREELLHGVLSCDLLGFHTHDYARHFRSACTKILGLNCSPEGVEIAGASVTVGTFPIGINPDRFLEMLESPTCKAQGQELAKKFKGKKIILGIDRLDYTKGLPHKLYAMEHFLQNNPQWIGKVILIQIAVPTRSEVAEYQNLASKVHELVGRINGRFSTLTDSPIQFLDTSIPFDYMCALYKLSDVIICSSIRDGMNLVAFEYIVCQQGNDQPGVLILSEFTGAAQSLGAGAIRVNPWHVEEMSDALRYALTMSPEERQDHHRFACEYVKTHTAQHWAESYLAALQNTPDRSNVPLFPEPLNVPELLSVFSSSPGHRLIITGK
jgi:trehalose 6-phosphate synthase/phosphatase